VIPYWLISVLGVGGSMALIVIAAVVGNVRDQRYRGSLAAWAAARGWTCRDGGGGEWESLLTKGNGGRAVRLELDGTRQGRPVTVALYWYQITDTRERMRIRIVKRDGPSGVPFRLSLAPWLRTTAHTHREAVIVVRMAARYPAVALEWRRPGARPRGPLGRQLDERAARTGNGEFDRRYWIRTSTASTAASLLTPELISAHLTSDLPLWQLRDDQLVITYRRAIRVDDLDRKIDQALKVAGLLGSLASS
jgi:hypothetical protein